jgi:hypothetical protein
MYTRLHKSKMDFPVNAVSRVLSLVYKWLAGTGNPNTPRVVVNLEDRTMGCTLASFGVL